MLQVRCMCCSFCCNQQHCLRGGSLIRDLWKGESLLGPVMFMELLWDLAPNATPKFLSGSGDLWDAHVISFH